MKLLVLLMSFLPVVAFGANSYSPGESGWNKAANDVAMSEVHTISNVCKVSKGPIQLSLSNNQETNYRCEIARTITHACSNYAMHASGWLMTNREGQSTPEAIWHDIMNGIGGQPEVGAFSAWESSTYAPQSITAGDLYWKDYTECMSHYRQ